MADVENAQSPEPSLGVEDALAWASYKLIEAMAQREAVEMACIILRAAGIDVDAAGTFREARSSESSAKSIFSMTWEAVRQANAVYGALLAEWFGMFVSMHERQTDGRKPSQLPIGEVLDALRAESMRLLDRKLDRQLSYEKKFNAPWCGEARTRMAALLKQVARNEMRPSALLGRIGDTPSPNPVTSAEQILDLLGCREEIVKNTMATALRRAGLPPDGGRAADAPWKLFDAPPKDAADAAVRVLRVLNYDEAVAHEALDKILLHRMGADQDGTKSSADDVLAAFEEIRRDSSMDIQEKAYRVLRILGYDEKIAEGALVKAIGFVPAQPEEATS